MKNDVKQSTGPETFVYFECIKEKNIALNQFQSKSIQLRHVALSNCRTQYTKYRISLFRLFF